MKVSKFRIALMLLCCSGAVALTGCSDTEDGSYVAPITLSEKINGEWALNSLTQVDEVAQTSKDLTAQFAFSSFIIQLDADAQGEPTSFSIGGQAPALLPTSGTWEMENNFYNSNGNSPRIFLNSNGQRVASLTVTSVPGATRTLELKLTRRQNGQAFVSYIYNLAPATLAK